MKPAFFLGLILLIAGCTNTLSPKAEQTLTVSNHDYKVEKLFTDPNGVRLYRFYDQGDWRYYLTGPNGAQMLPSTTHVTDTVVETDTVYVSGGGGGGHHK